MINLEMAKVTSKGQITIPVSIRRRLEINEGDKLLFIEKNDGFLMVNPNRFQMERFDELPAPQAPATDDQLSAALSGLEDSDWKKPSPPLANGEGRSNPSGGFDVAALLNEIRSMGSKI